MRHITFAPPADNYPIALLIKGAAFSQPALEAHYLHPLQAKGLQADQVIAFDLQYDANNKAPVKLIKEYLAELLPALDSIGVKYLYVADGNYFKVLAKQGKAEPHVGYVLPCGIEGYSHMQVVLGLNYQALVYDPSQQNKLNLGLETLAGAVQGTYQHLGTDVIHHAEYPENITDIAVALERLHQYPELTCDIEAFSLKPFETGIGSIGFAWNQHEGISFLVDYQPFLDPQDVAETGLFGYRGINLLVRALLKRFFTEYRGSLTFHNASFDIRSLIAELWMEHPLDHKGLLEGLGILTRHFHDTKIIAYLATNSTAGNELSLKTQAHEFAGNYAQNDEDIKDIRRIRPKDLLAYNLVDCLCTWFVRHKRYPEMVRDRQEALYYDLFLPSLKVIIQMELTGMPMQASRIQEAKAELERLQTQHLGVIQGHPVITLLEDALTLAEWETDYADRKAKAKNPEKIKPKDWLTYPRKEFNPNSGPQLQRLLYQQMGLPVIDFTETKQPATGADTLEKLVHHTQDAGYQAVIQALIDYGKVTKILSAFIPAFEAAMDKGDGRVWLHGNFNLGGTVSGRLSSSKPNLQQIPAGSTFGKLIKGCFSAPDDWLFCGADFNSLEDYISALTTKDPNKLNVYLKGFDGHCLRAAYYFQEDLLARGIKIALDDPTSVNSIKKLAADLRQDSKAPTFALTYQGTAYTLMNNLGWSEAKAKAVEANYHDLYKVSDQYVAERLRRACKDGYVEVAFGLRVRTPLLAQTILGMKKTPPAAAAEGRTAGNALGQSYGLLNNRAANAFMAKVWASPYRHDILPVALIHDAIYLLVRNRLDVVAWANTHLIQEMRWQELPEIQHDQVKLGAALDIFWPDWAHAVTLPNDASQEEIQRLCLEYQDSLNPEKETL